MERMPFEGLVTVKNKWFQGHMQFGVECDFMWYENKVGTIEGIHLLNLLSENSSKGVQKPS
jgi:hypothetical protein